MQEMDMNMEPGPSCNDTLILKDLHINKTNMNKRWKAEELPLKEVLSQLAHID